MMEQYLEVKKSYPDTILFFRMGDFFEMFLDDAVTASRELGLTLTSRNKSEKGNNPPMCGVPHHAADGYIAKLVAKGYKVAVCEQVEDPKQAKGIVKREVVRIVTPGTVTDDVLLDEKKNNFLCSIALVDERFGVSFSDITTGEMFATELLTRAQLINELARYNPSEILLTQKAAQEPGLFDELAARFESLVERAEIEPDFDHCKEIICLQFGVENLRDLGMPEEGHILLSVGVLLTYLEQTQKIALGHIKSLQYYTSGDYMDIDIFTRRNLELTETMRTKSKKGSLLWVLDHTETSMGGRLLRSFVEKPLVNCAMIQKRLYAVDELVKKQTLREDLLESFKHINDLERLIGRVVCKSANARDLLSLSQSLTQLPELELLLYQLESPLMQEQCRQMDSLGDIAELLEASIAPDAPLTIKEGGIIKKGYDAEVDEYRDLLENGQGALARIEAQEKEKTGIKTLRVGFNRVFGYYIEVSKSYKDQVPEHYVRKQTLANGERYITEELKELESKVLTAEDRVKAREYELFCAIREKVAENVDRVQKVAYIIALADVMCSFASVAAKNNYCMPYVDMSDKIEIENGRHPVVERVLKDELFVPNDTKLNAGDDRMLIITGPNMAGKSTYMRQVAVITLMAQIGSFVPASSCTIGICDKIFTRVGASDDLTAGQSTFMVEMVEVSNILKNATAKSLLILDEIGRGTSTYDGLSIAWAVTEHIADKKKLGARTLFATHYHEMTELEGTLDGVKNYNIACKKRGDDITFLRRIVRGGADDSYGIEVAALAGIPQKVISRAKEILGTIEKKEGKAHTEKPAAFVSDSGQIGFGNMRADEIMQTILDMDLATVSPIEALNKLYELQKIAKS
ncbi:MAG: DNA mismatch repair protein MutS [Clostridia bacterium]|nr:DNA mismatch repair protein MutS [Clostridia bacterium]